MPRRTRIVTWNGKDIRPELLALPADAYVPEAVEEDPPVLPREEQAGIEEAIESYHSQIVDAAPRR